jgi:protein MAK16
MDMIDDETDEEELEAEVEWGEREFVSDLSDDEDDGLSDLEDIDVSVPHQEPGHIQIAS